MSNRDVEIVRDYKGATIITFKRMFAVAFQLPIGMTIEEFITNARPLAEQAFAKITEPGKPKRIKFKPSKLGEK